MLFCSSPAYKQHFLLLPSPSVLFITGINNFKNQNGEEMTLKLNMAYFSKEGCFLGGEEKEGETRRTL